MSPILGIVASGWDNTPSGAFESIATVTAAGGESSLTFSSIPSTYSSLQIRGIARNNSANTSVYNLNLRLNSDSSSNYAWHYLQGDGANVAAGGVSSTTVMYTGQVFGNNSTANAFSVFVIDLHDYANTTKNKTVRSFGSYDLNGSGYVELSSGLWMSTSAVTSVSLLTSGNGFRSGTTFALYGIKGA